MNHFLFSEWLSQSLPPHRYYFLLYYSLFLFNFRYFLLHLYCLLLHPYFFFFILIVIFFILIVFFFNLTFFSFVNIVLLFIFSSLYLLFLKILWKTTIWPKKENQEVTQWISTCLKARTKLWWKAPYGFFKLVTYFNFIFVVRTFLQSVISIVGYKP